MKISQISPCRNFNFGNSKTTQKKVADKKTKTTKPGLNPKLAAKILVPASLFLAASGCVKDARISKTEETCSPEPTVIIEEKEEGPGEIDFRDTIQPFSAEEFIKQLEELHAIETGVEVSQTEDQDTQKDNNLMVYAPNS